MRVLCLILILGFLSFRPAHAAAAQPDESQPHSASTAVGAPPPVQAVDLRPEFGRWGLVARRQGDRPTCSAFTVATALEFAVAKRQGHSPRLSVEFLNWAAMRLGYRDEAGQPGGGVFIFRNTSGNGRDGFMPYVYAQAYMNDGVWVDFEARTGRSLASSAVGSSEQPAAPSPGGGEGAQGAGERQSGLSAGGFFHDPLGTLATRPSGRSRRISSNELPKWNDANLDMTVLPPGKALEMPRLEGPGVITHIWFTSHAGRANELNALSLRIYWDGRTEPGVEVPLGEFFAVGQGKPASVESVPVQVSPSGSRSCYCRRPFAKSARLVVANDNPDRTTGLYWQADSTELDELPPATPYFHACYRQEYPAVAGGDYLIADLAGRGQYVGTVMSVTLG